MNFQRVTILVILVMFGTLRYSHQLHFSSDSDFVCKHKSGAGFCQALYTEYMGNFEAVWTLLGYSWAELGNKTIEQFIYRISGVFNYNPNTNIVC